jgi:hypothetical protein
MIPAIGRNVHYVIDDGPSYGQHRPATIVYVYPRRTRMDEYIVNLQVLTDGALDLKANVVHRMNVHRDEKNKLPGSWHEPERVEETALQGEIS